MGLDIYYYDNVVMAEGNEAFDETGELLDDHYVQVYVNPYFPDRCDSLIDRRAYKYNKYYHFRAGSYSGYNEWRNELAKLAGYPSEMVDRYGTGNKIERHDISAWERTEGPFWELICFSDCEGVIGPDTSKKLAKDFSDYQEKADKHGNEWFRSLYSEWRKAFEVASNNGFVKFR